MLGFIRLLDIIPSVRVLRECVISSVLSRHNKNLKLQMLKALGRHSSQAVL